MTMQLSDKKTTCETHKSSSINRWGRSLYMSLKTMAPPPQGEGPKLAWEGGFQRHIQGTTIIDQIMNEAAKARMA